MSKKQTYKIPSFLEILQSQRIQVKTPRGGSHKSKQEYNRKELKRQLQKELKED